MVDEPFPQPQRWGEAEEVRLKSMLDQRSLFYWRGPQTAALLQEFRNLYPLQYCFPCSSGTAAVHVALAALRLKPGEEVIVPPITDMGSVIGILYQQGVPVFADVEARSYTLDPQAVNAAITSRTRAIMTVHLAGNPSNLTVLAEIARSRGLVLIEDCAQAWGAQHQGEPVGLIGHFGCFSFNDFKHISCGDGGIVGTNLEKFGTSLGKWGDKSYDRVAGERDPALLRDPADLALNYRISEPQAAVAAAQLTRLEGIVRSRVATGVRLNELLATAPGLLTPEIRNGDTHSFWFYLLRLQRDRFRVGREEFVQALKAEGVAAWAGYLPKPVYGYRVFQTHNFFGGRWPVRDFGLTSMDYREVRCPVAEAVLEDCVLLPLNEAMTPPYVEKVARAILAVAGRLVR